MPDPDVVIVGAGPAGCAAAVQCARLGYRPHLLDRHGAPGGLVRHAWRIENYPGADPMPGPRFAERLASYLARFDLRVERDEIRSVRCTRDGCLAEGDTRSYEAAHLILATGTRPLAPPVAGLDVRAPGWFTEVGDLLAEGRPGGRAAVVGGGEAACDYALNLAEHGWQVVLLVRGATLRAQGRLATWVHNHPAILVMPRTLLHAVERPGQPAGGWRLLLSHERDLDSRAGDPSSSAGAAAASGRMDVDALLVATGRESAVTALLATAGLRPGHGLHTSDPRVLVIGDARSGTLGQIGMAVGDGLAAAMFVDAARRPATLDGGPAPRFDGND